MNRKCYLVTNNVSKIYMFITFYKFYATVRPAEKIERGSSEAIPSKIPSRRVWGQRPGQSEKQREDIYYMYLLFLFKILCNTTYFYY